MVTKQWYREEKWVAALIAVWCSVAAMTLSAQEPSDPAPNQGTDDQPELAALPRLADEWKLLTNKDSVERVWVHPQKKQVAVEGEVCLTKGYLEMFACVSNTKEHESVVALKSRARHLHAALLAVGAKVGSPAEWRPVYKPATGTTVKIRVQWVGDDGKPQTVDAQQWVRDLKTKKAMKHDWVFAGSRIWKDPETNKTHYSADYGEVICVSNFPTAMLDLPIKSSQATEELSFEALTENIPKRRTPVRVYLVPQLTDTPPK